MFSVGAARAAKGDDETGSVASARARGTCRFTPNTCSSPPGTKKQGPTLAPVLTSKNFAASGRSAGCVLASGGKRVGAKAVRPSRTFHAIPDNQQNNADASEGNEQPPPGAIKIVQAPHRDGDPWKQQRQGYHYTYTNKTCP